MMRIEKDRFPSPMTPREQAAYNAGIEQMRQMATIAAITLETRPDADDLRHRAAAAALYGLAEGAKALLPAKSEPIVHQAPSS